MATGKSGYIYSNAQNLDIRYKWEETYDPLTNKSPMQITAADVRTGAKRKSHYTVSGSITADGAPWANFGNLYVYVNSADNVTWQKLDALDVPFPWTITIPHEVDGSKTVNVSINTNCHMSGLGTRAVTGSGTITLTHIPRASGIGATDADIESTSVIAVSRKSDAYTHTIAYRFGDLSGYIAADGSCVASAQKLTATSIPWTVPASFYAQIPSAKSGVCTLTCTTYSGGTQVAEAQTARITCTAAESRCAPELTASVRDGNETTVALTGSTDTLVRYFSAAVCTMQATARNGASIVSRSIAGADAPDGRRTITNVETGSITFATTDSRGYSRSLAVTKSLVPYVRLTNKPTATRDDPTSGRATLHLSGACWAGFYGATMNEIHGQYTVSGVTHAVTVQVSGEQYSLDVPLTGLDYRQSHTIRATVWDSLMRVVVETTLPPGIPLMDCGENDVNINVPLRLGGRDIVELFPTMGGAPGPSNYERAKFYGFQGTEQEYLDSLRYTHSGEFAQLSAQVRADADRAQQAAGQSGYMDVMIDSRGRLIYRRTDNTQNIDFRLEKGRLIFIGS